MREREERQIVLRVRARAGSGVIASMLQSWFGIVFRKISHSLYDVVCVDFERNVSDTCGSDDKALRKDFCCSVNGVEEISKIFSKVLNLILTTL